MSFNLEDAISRYRHFQLNPSYVFYSLVIIVICYWWKSTSLKNPSRLPVIGRKWYELGNGKAKQRYLDDCLGLVRSCLEKVSNIQIPIPYPYPEF